GAERLALLRIARRVANDQTETAPAESGASIVRVALDGTVVSGMPPANLPVFRDGRVHVGRTATIDFAVAPVVDGGQVVEEVYAFRPLPATSFPGRIGATLRFLSAFWWQFLLAGALSAGIALAMARWLARGTTQPLRDMTAAARRMEIGDYSVRVRTRGRDEVGQLAQAFNRMSAELESLEQTRRDLVANVSHELKTPIAAIRAHLENLLDGVEEPDPKTIQIMLTQSERLGRLVEQLL